MPSGFVGGAAKKYLKLVQNALDAAIDVHNAHAHGASIANETMPYEPSEALTGSASGTGIGNVTNIVVDADAYFNLSYHVARNWDDYGVIAYQVFEEVERMCGTDFILPATTPKLLAMTERFKTSLYEVQDVYYNYGQTLRDYVRDIIGDEDTGHNVCLAWNASIAEGIRNQNERTLTRQTRNMEDTIGEHERTITRLEEQRAQQLRISRTATMWIDVEKMDSHGFWYTAQQEVPDVARRQRAASAASDLQAQIDALRASITALWQGFNRLHAGIAKSNNFFEQTQNGLQQIDRSYAERIRLLGTDLHTANARVMEVMNDINAYFSPSVPGGVNAASHATGIKINNVEELQRFVSIVRTFHQEATALGLTPEEVIFAAIKLGLNVANLNTFGDADAIREAVLALLPDDVRMAQYRDILGNTAAVEGGATTRIDQRQDWLEHVPEVMLQYILEKNGGTMRNHFPYVFDFLNWFNSEGGESERGHFPADLDFTNWHRQNGDVVITIDGRSVVIASDLITDNNGILTIDPSVLMNAFGLTQEQATHRPWNQFTNTTSASIAWALMYTDYATMRNREWGSSLYWRYNNEGNRYYTFGDPWEGMYDNVIAGFVQRITTRHFFYDLTGYRMAGLVHSHPQGYRSFSDADISIANGGFRALTVPMMPVYLSVNLTEVQRNNDGWGMEVRRVNNFNIIDDPGFPFRRELIFTR